MVAEPKPEIEPDRSFEEWLRKTVEVLCAQRPPLFRFESELRLCQLKAWLLAEGDDLATVRRIAMTFAAAMIGRRMAQVRRKRNGEAPSSHLIIALKNPDFRILFDFAFPPPSNLYSLATGYSMKDVSDWPAADADKIRCLNELTRWRLRLAKTERFKPTPRAGLDAYEAARNPDNDFGITKVKEFHTGRARREAFLYVATTACSEILEITPSPSKILQLLKEQANQTELFKRYFARCQTALELLEEKNPAAATLRAWSGVEAVPLDDVEPITKDEQESIGLYPKPPRPAKTTKRAKRQKAT
jgi:hypothetical protein